MSGSLFDEAAFAQDFGILAVEAVAEYRHYLGNDPQSEIQRQNFERAQQYLRDKGVDLDALNDASRDGRIEDL